jgi:hypothetical protein
MDYPKVCGVCVGELTMNWRGVTSFLKEKITGLMSGFLSSPCTTYPCDVQIPINGKKYSISTISSTWKHICRCNPQLNPRNKPDYKILCVKVEQYLVYSFLFFQWKAYRVANKPLSTVDTNPYTHLTLVVRGDYVNTYKLIQKVRKSTLNTYFRHWTEYSGLVFTQREQLLEFFIERQQKLSTRRTFTALQMDHWDIEFVQPMSDALLDGSPVNEFPEAAPSPSDLLSMSDTSGTDSSDVDSYVSDDEPVLLYDPDQVL